MNSLIEESTIRALYLASSAGVKVDLIVRGACSLRPGVPGLSENIRVRSIIGRFLEHERIYYFRNDLKQNLYLSSADWMGRNLFRRIEVAFPILDPTLKRRVIEEGLRYYIKDNTNSWVLQTNGEYKRRKIRRKQVRFGAQQYLASVYDANAQDKTVPEVKPRNIPAVKASAEKAKKAPEKTKPQTTRKPIPVKAAAVAAEATAAAVEPETPVVNKDIEILPVSDVSST